jgi:urease accessory protein
MLLNTSGGIADGDRLDTVLAAGPGSRLTVATQAAERVYRARDGAAAARVQIGINVAAGARLEYLPQETILFNAGAMDRVLRVEMAGDACYLGVETLLFGRAASGEVLRELRLRDTVMLHRDGRLVLYDSVRLDGRLDAVLGGKATAGGAGAVASLLYAAPDAPARLDGVRGALEGHLVRAGASVRDGVLVARIVAADGQVARRAVAAALGVVRDGTPLPRAWSC